MNSYVTIFDFATRLPFGWHIWVMIATTVAIAVAIPLRFRQTGRWRGAVVALIGALALGGAFLANSLFQYFEVARAVSDGRVQTAEGAVTNFSRADRHHAVEAFEIGGQQFSYHYGLLNPGYGSPQQLGGALREGLRARVTFYDASWHERIITKLEIVRDRL